MHIKNKIYPVLAIVAFLCGFNALVAQGTNPRHRIGFVSGIGGQAGLNVTYDYQVLFFQAQYYYALPDRKTRGIDILIQPQYNLTKYKAIDSLPDRTNGFEFGLNGGILIRRYILADLLSLYAFISTGPHYVSGSPQRQSNGFIFSDNGFIGINIRMRKNIYLDVRTGFRHISNANLNKPNGGVNNLVFSAGFLVNLQTRKH